MISFKYNMVIGGGSYKQQCWFHLVELEKLVTCNLFLSNAFILVLLCVILSHIENFPFNDPFIWS